MLRFIDIELPGMTFNGVFSSLPDRRDSGIAQYVTSSSSAVPPVKNLRKTLTNRPIGRHVGKSKLWAPGEAGRGMHA